MAIALLKRLFRDGVASSLATLGATAPHRRAASQLSIATFHRVLPASQRRRYALPGLVVTPSELEFFVRYFTSRYTVGPLNEIWARWQRGGRPPRPLLALTFDDAQLDNFVHARPVLERCDARASFYAPTEHIDSRQPIWHDRLGFALLAAIEQQRTSAASSLLGADLSKATLQARIESTKDLSPERREQLVQELEALTGAMVPAWAELMTWDQLRTLHGEGHEIGSHSQTHALLPQVGDEQLEREVHGSKRRLEEQLGAAVTTFCYPNGDTDARVAACVAQAGYDCAVTTRWGANAAGEDAFWLRRCDMHADHARNRHGKLSAPRIALRMSGLQPGLR